jgi:hypothetical protein
VFSADIKHHYEAPDSFEHLLSESAVSVANRPQRSVPHSQSVVVYSVLAVRATGTGFMSIFCLPVPLLLAGGEHAQHCTQLSLTSRTLPA